jgi:hypothetical protein
MADENEYEDIASLEVLDLTEALPSLLATCRRISRSDRDEAIKLIRQHYSSQEPLEISESGPCLKCHKLIGYKICHLHTRCGEEWLIRLRSYAEQGFYVNKNFKFEDGGICIAGDPSRPFGLGIRFFGGYVCRQCTAELKVKFAPFAAAQADEASRREEQHKAQAEAMHAELAILLSMPYKEYLQTEHWQMLRKSALRRSGYSCELCSSRSSLNVHHKTYERRGREYASDLTVLCYNCHAKFHDKLPKELPSCK